MYKNTDSYRVAIIGCGRMGQNYIEAYSTYPDTDVVAIVDPNSERLRVVGERFDIDACYTDLVSMLNTEAPNIAVIVTPVKFMPEAVDACAKSGVIGIQIEKPIGGVLKDADNIVNVCQENNVILAGGNLQRAMNEVQEAAKLIHSGQIGSLYGAAIHGFGGEIVGGGCQHLSILRLFTQAEVKQVVAWGSPHTALEKSDDEGLIINGVAQLTNGLHCPIFADSTPSKGVDVWTEEALVRWDWGPPEIFVGTDSNGKRKKFDPQYTPYKWSQFSYLTGSIRSFLTALSEEGELWISGHDLRVALEIAIALKESAQLGSIPIDLPISNRDLSLYPRTYRWEGGDISGNPQALSEAAGR